MLTPHLATGLTGHVPREFILIASPDARDPWTAVVAANQNSDNLVRRTTRTHIVIFLMRILLHLDSPRAYTTPVVVANYEEHFVLSPQVVLMLDPSTGTLSPVCQAPCPTPVALLQVPLALQPRETAVHVRAWRRGFAALASLAFATAALLNA